jgi:ABC-type multidrug transport system ATPase subunit
MNIDSGGNDASTVGTELVFKNISYEVPVGVGSWNTETTQILHRVSGYACTGQLLALMGASGAGKTTLLDIIAGRKSFGHVSGDIYLNGKNQNHILSSRLHSSAYVTQDSVHLPELTVRETLEFAAALRLDESMTSSEKRMRVEQMLELLDLSDHSETIVGDEKHRGISGGQRKRVSIAVEIMHLPTLLFMDEPTTGLDSARALEVISFARAFADRDRVVICTIHQPSPHICELFDNLLLLSNGRMVYFGPFRNAVEFFVTSPFEFSVGEGVTNPAEFLIAVASSSVVSSSGVNISSTHLASYFEETSTFATMIRSINNLIDGTTITSKEGEPAVGLRPSVNGYYLLSNAARRTFSWKLSSWSIFRRVSYPTSTVNQIRVLCYRVLLCTYRNRLPIILTTLR